MLGFNLRATHEWPGIYLSIVSQFSSKDSKLVILRNTGKCSLPTVSGATIAMTSTLTDYYQADEGWWKEGFTSDKGTIFIDDRGLDLSVNAVVTGVVVPILVDDKVAGLIKVNFKMAHIPAIISNPYEDGDVLVFMHRANGTAVVNSSEELHEFASETELQIMAKKQESGWANDEHHDISAIMGFALVKPEHMIYSRLQSDKSLKGITGENWGMIDWYVFVERDQDKAYEPLNDMMITFIFGGGVNQLNEPLCRDYRIL